MNGKQFIQRVRRWAKDKDLERPGFLAKKGAGSPSIQLGLGELRLY